jgi:NAD-dependent dihydropyrimidine dehydrogenase PreA subunit
MQRTDVTLALDAVKCTGCGLCVDVCPHAVFSLKDHRAEIGRWQDCMECGACQRNCRPGAISVQSGVGCAAAMINGALRGTEACCGGPDAGSCCG